MTKRINYKYLVVRGKFWYWVFYLNNKQHKISTGYLVQFSSKMKMLDPPEELLSKIPYSEEQRLELVQEQMVKKKEVPNPNVPKLITDYIDIYLEKMKELDSDPGHRKRSLNKFREVFGHYDLRKVPIGDVMDFHENLQKKYRDGTVSSDFSYIKRMFNYAKERGDIKPDESPFYTGAIKIKAGDARERVMTDDEQIVMEKYMKDWFYVPFKLAVDTGMRIGELAILERSWVNFNAGHYGRIELPIISTKQGKQQSRMGKRVTGSRHIYISLETSKLMKSVGASKTHPYFFSSARGAKLSKNYLQKEITKVWQFAAVEISLRNNVKLSDITGHDQNISFHVLRHTAATRDGNNGFTLRAIMAKYGWKKPEIAMRYVHEDDDAMQRLVLLTDSQQGQFVNTSNEMKTLSA